MDAAPRFTNHVPQVSLRWRLRIAREEAGLEQPALAALAGISTRSIVNYERGYTVPRPPVLLAWAVATGVSLAWLREGTEPNPEPEDGEAVENMRRTCFSDFALVRGPAELPKLSSVHPKPALRVIS